DEAATDRQAETGAGATAILGLHPVKLVEDAFEIARRDARPLVDDLNQNGVAPNRITGAPSAKLDAAALRGVFGGVIEQVEQDLLEQDRVEKQHRQIRVDADFDPMARQNASGTLQGRADDVG